MNISELITAHETAVRMGSFFGVLILMAVWEVLAPRRASTVSKIVRWGNNLGLVVFNSVLLRLVFPTAAVGVTIFASEHSWGLLNYVQLPSVAAVAISIVVMDFVIYVQHILMHTIPALWRLHRVHHADLDYDFTTGVRFHPLEIIVSMLIKFSAILILGPPVIAVLMFEVILNAMSMFNHGNVKLPAFLDRNLRLLIVTPDMHRIHHSVEEDESNQNFGFNLSLWDRFFGTYRKQPRAGHEEMVVGIQNYRGLRDVTSIQGLLLLPFRNKPDELTVDHHKSP
ncbi:MAG: sterol desaturase family protein [Proteobacteria bacterium]|nr:sterol desaturase family protein [Pseudomonadota bacterium]MDB4825453.1 sterol desaturase family protein [Gammaproteobacteria bacterium]MBT4107451.1 sterol desaturase family protein [Pseudomonadota bacterium]MBT4357962.1 sterol desaturase family protein [Pseudomonadota bacterium]MBT4988726.1 sterol desaturase family protein [Pseudomonadota bacterium]